MPRVAHGSAGDERACDPVIASLAFMSSRHGGTPASDVIAERERRLREDPEFRALVEQKEVEHRERVRRLREAEMPVIRDLAAVGVEVDSVWNLCKIPDSRPKAIPVLLEHLTRDYPDRVLQGIGMGLNDKSARAWWAQLKSLYLDTKRDAVRDVLASALSGLATRAHYDDLVSFLTNDSLGETRIYFLRPINRIGNRMAAGRGRAVIEQLATAPIFAKEASAILAGRGPND
jgi:hypothetical protein